VTSSVLGAGVPLYNVINSLL